MQVKQQFTAFLENKPGRLSAICSALAKDKISILGLTVMDSKEHSVLRFVVDREDAARGALQRLGTPFSVTEVVIVDLKHQSGAIARVCERLASEHVNIDYIYCSSGDKAGRTIAILKATPIDKVKAVLTDSAPPKNVRTVRRPPAGHK